MFPSLLSTASASRWYHKKPTQQEKLAEIEYMEEKLAEQRMADKEVGVRILIRGKPAVSLKASNMNEQEDDHDDMVEEETFGGADDNVIEPDEEQEEDRSNFDTHNNNSDLYNPYEPDDDDEDLDRQPSSDNNFGFSFSQSSP